jgi:hypothetical protein
LSVAGTAAAAIPASPAVREPFPADFNTTKL